MTKQTNENMTKKPILAVILIFSIILLMQLDDSFCTNLYDKLQSLLITDFLVIGKNMDENTATAKLGLYMLPCYAITMLAPIARSLVDRFGKRPIFLINLIMLGIGCVICMTSNSLLLYLIGNALVTFGVSMDIQCIYIVDELPFKLRGTAKGISSGVATFAAMCIPICRSLLIDKHQLGWRSIYVVGLLSTFILFIISWILLKIYDSKLTTDINAQEIASTTLDNQETKSEKSNLFIDLIKFPAKNKSARLYLILLFILGIATAGITFYNEPLISFAIKQETTIDYILFIQPIVLFLITLISGILFDRIGRLNSIIICSVLSGIAITVFVINVNTNPIPILLAITWGLMIGGYYSAIDLLNLLVVENTSANNRGKASAIATILYGVSDGIGMLLVSLVALALSSGVSKLILSIPFLIIAIVIIISYLIKHKKTI